MLGRILSAVVSLFLILVLTETQTWAIFNCYDYVFYRLTGLDAMPPRPADRDPKVDEYGPACRFDRSKKEINGFACIEAVLNKKGNYAAIPTDTSKTPVPRLAPGDVIYIPGKHVAYAEKFNYDRDPNLYDTDPGRDIKPRDLPVISHYLEIPHTYYSDPTMDVIDASSLGTYRYGYMKGYQGASGGFSASDTFQQMLEKDNSRQTAYVVYKKLRLDVIIEVLDGKGKPIPDAYVDLDGKTHKTGSKGRILVELEPDKYRDRDLPFVIRKAGFKDEKRALYAFQMKPSGDFIVYPADLEPADLKELMDKLNADLAEKRKALNDACLALVTLDEEQEQTIQDTLSGYRVFTERVKVLPDLSKECPALTAKRLQVQTVMASIETQSGRLRTQVDQANGVKCETKSDLAMLESLDRQMLSLAWDAYNSAGRAMTVHRSIVNTLWQVDDLYTKTRTDPFLAIASVDEKPLMPEEGLKWLQTMQNERFATAHRATEKARADCEEAHRKAAKAVEDAAAAQGLASDPRVEAFVRSAKNMAPRQGQPCDEKVLKANLENAIKRYSAICTYVAAQRGAVAALKARCAALPEDRDFLARYGKSSENAEYYREQRNKLLKAIADCRAAVSKTPPAKKAPVKPSPPPSRVPMRIDGPAEAFVGDRMDFKAVILDKRYASGTLRPDGAYAMYWSVDGKRRGDGQYYSDTVNFVAATEGAHTLKVEFVWGDPKTGNVTPLGSAEKRVTIRKKERQNYANVSVPHGEWVKTGLSVKKGDVIEIEAKGAYTTKDGGKIGPEGGGRWGFWTLAVRYGKTVHLPGRGNTYYVEENGDVELGTPRSGGDKFLPEDIANLQGALTVRVLVKEKAP